MQRIILASQSPRRRELLAAMGVDFDVIPSQFDEHLDDSRQTDEVAKELALGKALDVARTYPDAIVIGSDTIVTTADGKQLEKPHDADEAHAMLEGLAGQTNIVTTGLAVLRLSDNTQLVGADSVSVLFKPYDEKTVAEYVATGDPLDKAGGYGIQSGAAPLVENMSGNYDTVIGLPTHLLADYLEQLGVQAKPVNITPPVPTK